MVTNKWQDRPRCDAHLVSPAGTEHGFHCEVTPWQTFLPKRSKHPACKQEEYNLCRLLSQRVCISNKTGVDGKEKKAGTRFRLTVLLKRRIRKIPSLENTIIAFLTARGEDYSQVAGFDAGADDYITKPVKPKVLTSRLKALLRRRPTADQNFPERMNLGDLIIDPERYHIELAGKVLDLPRKEFELLSLLASKPGRVFLREEIMDRIWGTSVIVGGRTIDVHIRKLREKIGDDRIKTVKGVGYKFESKN